MTSTPLVSCIMPTRNRRCFVGQSIWYFLRQDYPRKELIILDDGENTVADIIPADERIRYVRHDRQLSLGAKRNLGCDLGRGELIAHWDDDDWLASHRLSVQVSELLRSDSDMCVAREMLHYQLDADEAWLYRHPTAARPWLADGTLLYHRRAWTRSPFPEINVGEDTRFVWQQPAPPIRSVSDPSSYIAHIHSGNASTKRPTNPLLARRTPHALPNLTDPVQRSAIIVVNRSCPGTAEHLLTLRQTQEARN